MCRCRRWFRARRYNHCTASEECRLATSCVLLRGLLRVWGNHSRHAGPQNRNSYASMSYVNETGSGNARSNVCGALMSRKTEVIIVIEWMSSESSCEIGVCETLIRAIRAVLSCHFRDDICSPSFEWGGARLHDRFVPLPWS